jgi:SAM-dependent methyltransferase
MRLDTLQRVDLYCTSCAAFDGGISQHKLILIPGITSAEYVISGSLECSHCSKRYPIIDGVPCLSESVPGNQDLTGQYLDAHYGAINTRYWREMKAAAGTGTCLDVGCSVGRYTFECAQNGFAVGMDVNFEQIRLAAEFQRTGQIAYTQRRRALRDELKKSAFKPAGKTLFILADIHNPPFKMESFDFISALNVIDSVKYPLTALGQMDAMCKPNGTLLLSSPYSWNADVSAEFLETAEIEPHEFLKQLLTGRQVPECGFNYRFLAEKSGIPWRLRRRDSLEFVYTVDLLLAEKLQSS